MASPAHFDDVSLRIHTTAPPESLVWFVHLCSLNLTLLATWSVRWGPIHFAYVGQNLFGGWLMSPSLLHWLSKSNFQGFTCLFSSEVGCSLSNTPSGGEYVADLCAAFSYKEVCPTGGFYNQHFLSCPF
ncbi:hypothetical protein QN277_025559 [Acacia crassicarpa]|uniref:Uncharacterized protein n=1 Tax=Acacia crassicarpa TaxID=499986 RepID=A0AAE1ML21_9FABA|nr:hypothetical protein QN277_025559 [Acacia crassicarpa]